MEIDDAPSTTPLECKVEVFPKLATTKGVLLDHTIKSHGERSWLLYDVLHQRVSRCHASDVHILTQLGSGSCNGHLLFALSGTVYRLCSKGSMSAASYIDGVFGIDVAGIVYDDDLREALKKFVEDNKGFVSEYNKMRY